MSRKKSSGMLMRSGESFPSGGNCDNFPGPETPMNPLLHSPYLGSTASSCLGSTPSSHALSKPSHHLCFLSLETPPLSLPRLLPQGQELTHGCWEENVGQ